MRGQSGRALMARKELDPTFRGSQETIKQGQTGHKGFVGGIRASREGAERLKCHCGFPLAFVSNDP